MSSGTARNRVDFVISAASASPGSLVLVVRADLMSSRKHKLPDRITAGLQEMREQIRQAKLYHRKGRPCYLTIGKEWDPIKTDPTSMNMASELSDRYPRQFNG